MKDITSILHKASQNGKSTNWQAANVESFVIECLKNIPHSQLDWDREVPENWARILIKSPTDMKTSVGCACAVAVPLVLVQAQFFNDVRNLAQDDIAQVLEFSDWDEPVWKADPAFIRECFGDEDSGDVDFDSLSPNDLWWLSVN